MIFDYKPTHHLEGYYDLRIGPAVFTLTLDDLEKLRAAVKAADVIGDCSCVLSGTPINWIVTSDVEYLEFKSDWTTVRFTTTDGWDDDFFEILHDKLVKLLY